MNLWENKIFRIVFGSLILAFLILHALSISPNKDFDVFTAASRLVFEGKSCYGVWLKSGTSGLKYFYSPLFAVLLFPLKDAPQWFNNCFWLFCNLFFLYRTFQLLVYFLNVESWDKKKRFIFHLLCLLVSVRFILDNLFLGQMTPFLLWGSLESFRLFDEKKHLQGAALLALIINIKIIPLALLAYMIYKAMWRPALYVLAFSLLFLILPALAIGFSFNAQLHFDWLHTLSQTTGKSIYEDSCRPGFSSFVPSLLMDTQIQFDTPRNFLSLGENSVKIFTYGLSALLLLLLSIVIGRPFQKPSNGNKLFSDLAFVCLATPLVFPHQGKYALLYTLPAYAFCIHHLMSAWHTEKNTFHTVKLILLILSFTLVTLTTDGLIGRYLSDMAEYHHLLTYGCLFLLASMLI